MQIQLYGNNIWVFRQAVDFRSSIDGLSSLIISDKIKRNPQEGIYIFYNKNKDKLKCLSWHKNGFVLLYKRLELGKFDFKFSKNQGVVEINIKELGWLFAGLQWQKMRHWNELDYEQFS